MDTLDASVVAIGEKFEEFERIEPVPMDFGGRSFVLPDHVYWRKDASEGEPDVVIVTKGCRRTEWQLHLLRKLGVSAGEPVSEDHA